MSNHVLIPLERLSPTPYVTGRVYEACVPLAGYGSGGTGPALDLQRMGGRCAFHSHRQRACLHDEGAERMARALAYGAVGLVLVLIGAAWAWLSALEAPQAMILAIGGALVVYAAFLALLARWLG